MRLRLPRWLRREPAPQGRHVRRPAPVTAPGAAAALVVGAAEPWLSAPAPAPAPAPESELPPPEPDPVTERDPGPATEPVPVLAAPVEPAVAEAPDAAGTAPAELPAPVPTEAAAPEPTVALGFADGGVLELAPDDPRLAGFQDAAAAVLGRPQA